REHFEREQTWLELLCSNCLDHIPTERLLDIARQNRCYHVAEHLLERLGKYEEIFDCYLLDEFRRVQLFSYIAQHATDTRRQIYPLLVKNLYQIVDINCEQAVRVLVDSFMRYLSHFLQLLEQAGAPERLFRFLEALLKQSVQLETTDLERYLELLCQYRPAEVIDFLKSNDSYRLDNAVRTIKRFELSAPLIFLYEKQGDYQSAYAVAVETLTNAPEASAAMCALQVSALCTRASSVLTESDREQLWFSLLHIVLARNDLNSITKNILHSASEFVDLSKLVQLVLTSGTTSTGNFGDIKHLLIGMLSNSAYETLLLQTTSRILGQDLHAMLARERRIAMRGLAVKSIKCIVCRARLYNTERQPVVVMGDCGHAMHQQCAANFCTVPLDSPS
uniref:RING-type domain-containing protein n=1 Tax=Anopheles maculatus TaxID=74869 RepID=A0A182STW6_9DIPT